MRWKTHFFSRFHNLCYYKFDLNWRVLQTKKLLNTNQEYKFFMFSLVHYYEILVQPPRWNLKRVNMQSRVLPLQFFLKLRISLYPIFFRHFAE